MTDTAPADAPPTVHVAFARVMAEVQAIAKDRENTEQRFRFRGIDDVMNALHGPLSRHGLFFLPQVLERIDGAMERGANKTLWSHVKLKVRYRFFGPAGDYVDAEVWGEGLDNADKGTGKALSMAAKSALLQAFCIPTEDMDDPDATTPPPLLRHEGWWGGWESDVQMKAAHDPVWEQVKAAGDERRAEVRAWLDERGWKLPLPVPFFEEFKAYVASTQSATDSAPTTPAKAAAKDPKAPAGGQDRLNKRKAQLAIRCNELHLTDTRKKAIVRSLTGGTSESRADLNLDQIAAFLALLGDIEEGSKVWEPNGDGEALIDPVTGEVVVQPVGDYALSN